MFGGMNTRLPRALTSKVGLALVAALLLGGASAMAMATTHGQIFSNNLGSSRSASPTAHGADDQDDTDCTAASPATSTTHSADGDDHEGEATKTTGDHANPTKTAGDDADDHEGTECEGSDQSPKATHAPEPTEHPEGTHKPEPTERPEGTHTPGPGGD